MRPWEILGLTREEAQDPRLVKQAYARTLKAHRPDRDPEGFRRVRDAYEALTRPDGGAGEHVRWLLAGSSGGSLVDDHHVRVADDDEEDTDDRDEHGADPSRSAAMPPSMDDAENHGGPTVLSLDRLGGTPSRPRTPPSVPEPPNPSDAPALLAWCEACWADLVAGGDARSWWQCIEPRRETVMPAFAAIAVDLKSLPRVASGPSGATMVSLLISAWLRSGSWQRILAAAAAWADAVDTAGGDALPASVAIHLALVIAPVDHRCAARLIDGVDPHDDDLSRHAEEFERSFWLGRGLSTIGLDVRCYVADLLRGAPPDDEGRRLEAWLALRRLGRGNGVLALIDRAAPQHFFGVVLADGGRRVTPPLVVITITAIAIGFLWMGFASVTFAGTWVGLIAAIVLGLAAIIIAAIFLVRVCDRWWWHWVRRDQGRWLGGCDQLLFILVGSWGLVVMATARGGHWTWGGYVLGLALIFVLRLTLGRLAHGPWTGRRRIFPPPQMIFPDRDIDLTEVLVGFGVPLLFGAALVIPVWLDQAQASTHSQVLVLYVLMLAANWFRRWWTPVREGCLRPAPVFVALVLPVLGFSLLAGLAARSLDLGWLTILLASFAGFVLGHVPWWLSGFPGVVSKDKPDPTAPYRSIIDRLEANFKNHNSN